MAPRTIPGLQRVGPTGSERRRSRAAELFSDPSVVGGMDVRIAGSGPAIEAVRAALSDAPGELGTAVDPTGVDPGQIGGANLAVVRGRTHGDALATASESARLAGTPWIGIEIGGVGGHDVAGVGASVAGFAPGAGCYDCLQTRVAAADPDLEGSGSLGDARLAGAIAGSEALTLLAGRPSQLLRAIDDETRIGGVIEVPRVERTYLPVPGCACDEEGDRRLELGYVDRDLDTALERAELALDERVGPVSTVGEAESFPAPYYLAQLADTTGFSDASAAEQAAGVDPDWNRAFMKALGEALERYGAGVYRTEEFRRAAPGTVDGGVSPARFVRPDDAADVDPDEPIRWIPARTLASGADAFLPAEVVQFPPPEKRYLPPITTGLGLGSSSVEAVLSGLYEVIERDATMIAWYSTFEPLALSVADEGFRTLARRARSEGLSTTALLVTVDVDVPVVAAAVHRDGEWPQFAAGSAADLDPAAAARGALAEALQNWMELRSMGREAASEEPTAIARYADFPVPARDLVDSGDPVPADGVGPDGAFVGEAELDAVVERATAAGLEPHAASVTTRDLAAIGFEAVRVVAPGAQPLFTDRPAFGERARSVPVDLGYEPRLDRDPHPFP